jgi:hypothetical protein
MTSQIFVGNFDNKIERNIYENILFISKKREIPTPFNPNKQPVFDVKLCLCVCVKCQSQKSKQAKKQGPKPPQEPSHNQANDKTHPYRLPILHHHHRLSPRGYGIAG